MQQVAAPENALVLSSKAIDALRAQPMGSPPLCAPLQSIAEETELRTRTELLVTLLERELEVVRAADTICDIWRAARASDRSGLRLLMNVLEVRLSGVELLQRALVLRQFLRARQRATRGVPEFTAGVWRETLERGDALAARAGIAPADLHTPAAGAALRKRAGAMLERLLAGRLREAELAWLVDLAETEMRATAAHLGALAERVGDCDGRRISQLLPVLSRQEERIRDTRALLLKLPAPEDLVRRTPVLITRLEDRGFDGLVREIGARPEGLEIGRALVLTTWRAPLAGELGFFGGLVRLLADRYARNEKHPIDPARALLLALMSCRGGDIRLDLNPMEVRLTTALWEALGVEPRSNGFTLHYEARRHAPLLPEDGTPELVYPAVRRAPDLRVLVMANVQNEHVMTGLLALPRVAALPGLIEAVVVRSRSLKILLEVANRRDLYTGAANRNVPKALLWHPTNIPVSALRKFVHVRFVDRTELAALCARGSRARPEIRQMVAAYLDSLSSA